MKKFRRFLLCLIIVLIFAFGIPTLINSIIHNIMKEPVIENPVGEEQPVEVIINESSTEIPEGYIEDEFNLEEQEVEDEGFELQGEIAYNGSSELPEVVIGEYKGLTYYSQIDSRWKNYPYTITGNPQQTMGYSACGPTCAAMVVSSIKGTILPPTMADLFVQYGFRSKNNGTYWSAFRWTADVFDIGYKEIYKLNEVCDLLEENYMVVAACGNGLFTTGGHFILIYGYEDTNKDGQCDTGDRLKVYDPYLYSGKFNTSTRRGKAQVDGNTVYVEKETFRAYANYSGFFAFQNTHKQEDETPAPTISTYTRYVKVNTSLNIRSGPNISYSIVGSKRNKDVVTVYEESGNWSRVGNNEWVCSDYLSDTTPAATIVNTVGQERKFKSTTTLYSKSNLTGTYYTYLRNTKVIIKENVSSLVDKVYIPATGRTAYVSTSAYTGTTSTNVNTTTSKSLAGTYQKFKGNTTIYAYKTMIGTYYTYLPNTKVKVLEDLGNINKIYVPATGRYGYVYESVYK